MTQKKEHINMKLIHFTFNDCQINAEHEVVGTTRTCRLYEQKGHERDAVGLYGPREHAGGRDMPKFGTGRRASYK
eukprot:516707-Pleurochrysis_carterae.AAC.1